ncbi:MAG: hypothetical protein LWY06_16230 [Firmicutes bacterium]|nr:hypothetical protein [Bacillota bacterium]
MKVLFKRSLIISILSALICIALICYYFANRPVLSVVYLSFSKNGKEITSALQPYVWDCSSGMVMEDNSENKSPGLKTLISPDNRYLLQSSGLSLYDRKNKKVIFRHNSEDAVFTNNGKLVVFVDNTDEKNPRISTWSIEKTEILKSFSLSGNNKNVSYSIIPANTGEKDDIAAICRLSDDYDDYSGSIEIIDLTDGKILKNIEIPVKIIFATFNGTQLIIAGKKNNENRIVRINIVNFSQESDVLDIKGNIEAISGDGRFVAYFFVENKRRCFGIYNVVEKKVVSIIPEWSNLIRGGISFSPDGKNLAMGTVYSWPHNGEIRIFDVETGNCIKRLNAPMKIGETLSKLFSY